MDLFSLFVDSVKTHEKAILYEFHVKLRSRRPLKLNKTLYQNDTKTKISLVPDLQVVNKTRLRFDSIDSAYNCSVYLFVRLAVSNFRFVHFWYVEPF